MSDLFHPPSSEETLERIQARLGQGAGPAIVIEELMPRTRDVAISWGRRLAGWDEYRHAFPDQVIALARLISLRAMRAFGLTLREDGRVVDRPREGKHWRTPEPSGTFPLTIRGEEVRVAYTPGYFPNASTDVVAFISPHDPLRPHPLSETDFHSRFVPRDVIEACGGPQAYAALLAEALLCGEAEEFTASLEGSPPGRNRTRGRQAVQPESEGGAQPTPGRHAKRVVAEPLAGGGPLRQRTLFE
jgi:hypothetical protein